ncbi:hypothetical protein HMN09_01151000 [Mycena chlorophos]|uniref:Uncharacterized protein n=1 Tax=Mycena chlorophos TaxID=658473 RepID=A0A8H6VW85_MYCCL|nr:hypothetical protein HMN09_01151000 [Mycena chlorophos]
MFAVTWTADSSRQPCIPTAMPPKTPSKILFLRVKIHKLTIATTVAPTITVGALKTEVLSALTSAALESSSKIEEDLEMPDALDIPSVSKVSEFELCTAEKERGRLTGEFSVLRDTKQTLSAAGIVNWDVLFVRFKDPDSGVLQPVIFVPIADDEDQVTPQFADPAPPQESVKGKRKARPE